MSAIARVLPLSAMISACASTQPVTYTGSLTPVAGTCDQPGRATLTTHGHTAQFLPQEGVVVIDGTITPNGAVLATQSEVGMDRKPYRLTFTGQLQNRAVTGTYITPRCRYTVTLHQAKESPSF